jgi:class 3 adenylate cyclase
MDIPAPLSHRARNLRFGRLELDLTSGFLHGWDGAEIPLCPKSFGLLRHPVENADRLVPRDDLMEAVWPGVFVTDDGITQCVAEIRALGGAGQRLLRTAPKRGYMFGAEVARGGPPPPANDAAALPRLTAEDLTGLGVAVVGHRHRLLDAIAALRGGGGPAPTLAATQRHCVLLASPQGHRVDRAEPAGEAERRQITVLFCDLVGSTALSSRLDPEDLRDVIAAYHQTAAGTVARHGGYVASYMGDGVLAYFGWPRAHEDDPERAVAAGLDLVEAVGRLAAPGGPALQARVGIATGVVVVGDAAGVRERGAVGETPNRAARLQALAEPDAVVIDAGTRRRLGGLFECRELGPVAAKGFPAPVRAWRVLRPTTLGSHSEALHAAAGRAPLVGRDEEIKLLRRRWAQAKGGEGRVVLLSGEPGIGKSRLAAGLMERLAEEPHTELHYFCSPQHRDSPLFPVVGQLERAAGFAREDAPEARRGKLEALLARATQRSDEVAMIADLLGLPAGDRHPLPELSPQERRERLLDALLAQLAGLAARRPVLMLFEDAHWSDPTSLELLGLAVERLRRLPALLVVTFRPEFRPLWAGLPRVTALALGGLGRREAAALVARTAGEAALPGEVVDEIVERTGGVPLFVEELTRAVVEADWHEAAAKGGPAAAPLPSRAVPAALYASLMARLDRLGPAREVAQIGAVIGREFSYELLAAVARRPDAELRGALECLVEAGLVFRAGEPPRATYLFKHALVQEAAYGTLLRARRWALHAGIARVLADGALPRGGRGAARAAGAGLDAQIGAGGFGEARAGSIGSAPVVWMIDALQGQRGAPPQSGTAPPPCSPRSTCWRGARSAGACSVTGTRSSSASSIPLRPRCPPGRWSTSSSIITRPTSTPR